MAPHFLTKSSTTQTCPHVPAPACAVLLNVTSNQRTCISASPPTAMAPLHTPPSLHVFISTLSGAVGVWAWMAATRTPSTNHSLDPGVQS